MKRKAAAISAEGLRALQHYAWPGNVRELENEIERAIAMTDEEGIIETGHLSERFESSVAAPKSSDKLSEGELRTAVDELERTMIQNALAKYHGNKSQVSRILGLSRLGLQSKMNRLGIRE